MLKKHGIELFAEAIDIEILKRVFLALMNHGSKIGKAGCHGVVEAHVSESFGFERNRIIKEFLFEEDAGNTVPPQHHTVFLFRIRSAFIQCHIPLKHDVIFGRCTLPRQQFIPPGIDLRHLGKETVSAHVHAIAVMHDGTGYTAEVFRFLEYNDFIVAAFLQQFIRRRQSRRAGADNQHFFLIHTVVSFRLLKRSLMHTNSTMITRLHASRPNTAVFTGMVFQN